MRDVVEVNAMLAGPVYLDRSDRERCCGRRLVTEFDRRIINLVIGSSRDLTWKKHVLECFK